MARAVDSGIRTPARLSYLTVETFRIVVETHRIRPRIVRDRCVPLTVLDILDLVWASFRPNSGRTLNSFWGPFNSAEPECWRSSLLRHRFGLDLAGSGADFGVL